MIIIMENCLKEVSILGLLKFIRNSMEKSNFIKCEFGEIDWS